MTTNIPLFVILLALPVAASAQSAEKTYSKSFNTEGKGTIRFNLPGAIDLKIWETPTIRISMTVSIPSGNNAMLGELANVGRYNLVSKPEGEVLGIAMPNMQKQIRVKGEELRETFSFVVFVPKDLKIEMPNADTYAVAKKQP
jgi:hypothetical protein